MAVAEVHLVSFIRDDVNLFLDTVSYFSKMYLKFCLGIVAVSYSQIDCIRSVFGNSATLKRPIFITFRYDHDCYCCCPFLPFHLLLLLALNPVRPFLRIIIAIWGSWRNKRRGRRRFVFCLWAVLLPIICPTRRRSVGPLPSSFELEQFEDFEGGEVSFVLQVYGVSLNSWISRFVFSPPFYDRRRRSSSQTSNLAAGNPY